MCTVYLFLYQQTLTEMSGSMSRVKVCCWRFFRVSFILLSLKFLLVNLSKSLSLSVEGCSGQKRVVLPPWPPWRRRPWLFKSPRNDTTRNWWWVAICRKKSLLLTCTRDSQGFSATLPSSNFWWRCSRNESSRKRNRVKRLHITVCKNHQNPKLRSYIHIWSLYKKKPESIWNGALWLDDSFQKCRGYQFYKFWP